MLLCGGDDHFYFGKSVEFLTEHKGIVSIKVEK